MTNAEAIEILQNHLRCEWFTRTRTHPRISVYGRDCQEMERRYMRALIKAIRRLRIGQ